MSEQLHAGKLKGTGEEVWHSELDNGVLTYWCGSWHRRTPEELYAECQTILADLLRNHPELQAAEVARPWTVEEVLRREA